jgi:sulfur-carrier protein
MVARLFHRRETQVVRLVFLGKFGDMAPADLTQVALPGDVRSLADLQAWLTRTQPQLSAAMAATKTRLIVNQCVAHDMSLALAEGDEIAFLPPMSGG